MIEEKNKTVLAVGAHPDDVEIMCAGMFSILRIYWDDETEPSVECPVGDFFGTAKEEKYINSLAVCVNPGSGFNSFWQMPFRKKCKIALENIDEKGMRLYYQIDYTLTEVPECKTSAPYGQKEC